MALSDNESDHELDDGEVAGALGVMAIDTSDGNANSQENATAYMNNSEESARNDVEFLKSVIVNDRNLESIKAKLISTSEYRSKMLEDKEIDLRIEFPYFFISPNLVCLNRWILLLLEFVRIVTNYSNFCYWMAWKIGSNTWKSSIFGNPTIPIQNWYIGEQFFLFCRFSLTSR